jgi:hypothetical protein
MIPIRNQDFLHAALHREPGKARTMPLRCNAGFGNLVPAAAFKDTQL